MARERLTRGTEATGEIGAGPAAEAYADTAYPHATVDFAQVQAPSSRRRASASRGDSLTGGKKAGDRTLYAATHGRGAYRIDLPKR